MSSKETLQVKFEDWVAQAVAIRQDVEQRTITVRPDPEVPKNKVISFKMKVPGWQKDGRDQTTISVTIVHAQGKYEGLTLDVKLPQNLQHKDLPQFTDEAVEGWHKFVQRDLRQDPQYSWRIFPKIRDDEQEQLGLYNFNPTTAGEDNQVFLAYEDSWEQPFNPRDFGIQTKEEYVNLLLDALSRSYRVVTRYLETFNRQEISKLVQKRAERVKNKSAGWLAQTLLQRRDIDKKSFERHWLIPEEGVEPDTEVVGGIIQTKETGPCLFIFETRDLEDNDPHPYLNLIIFAPEELQQVLTAKHDQLAAYLERQKAIEKTIIVKAGKKEIAFNLAIVIPEGQKGSATAFRAEFFGADTRAFREAGISPQAIVNKTLDTFLGLLPYLKNFQESQKKS